VFILNTYTPDTNTYYNSDKAENMNFHGLQKT